MQSTESCLVEACNTPQNARGLCKTHYAEHRRRGTLEQFALVGKAKRATAPCSIDGCDLVAKSRSWCVNHYARWTRTGHPLGAAVTAQSVEARFFQNVEREGECWNWLGALNPGGYGAFWGGAGDKTWAAHRWSHSHFTGAIPVGFHIDHLCRNRKCVNPDHLEAVTPQENQKRAVAAHYADNERCPNGHLRSEVGVTVVYGNWNRCTPCVEYSSKRPRRSRSEMEK